jgi:uncharacterized protein
VHPALKTLIELQQLDLKVADLSAQIEKFPAQIAALENQLDEFIHRHEDSKHRLEANRKERRDLEGDIQVMRQKISKHRDQLYEVKTNEQYRAMLKEIDGEETNIRAVEDKILERMIEAEDLQKQVTETASHLEEEKSRTAAEKGGLEKLAKADADERDGLLARRNELAATLPEKIRNTYERIRRGRGTALAEVRHGLCTACNVVLRPQLYNEVRLSESLHECENCARILYSLEALPAASPAPGQPAVAQG